MSRTSRAPYVHVLLPALLLALPSCQMNERMSGTAFGAGGGAVVGGLAGDSVVGALIGGVGGALVGYLVGDYLADQRERRMVPAPAAGPRVAGARWDRRPSPSDEDAYRRAARALGGRDAPTTGGDGSPRLAPAPAEAWTALGLDLEAAGDRAGARAAYERALGADPGHRAARASLARLRAGR